MFFAILFIFFGPPVPHLGPSQGGSSLVLGTFRLPVPHPRSRIHSLLYLSLASQQLRGSTLLVCETCACPFNDFGLSGSEPFQLVPVPDQRFFNFQLPHPVFSMSLPSGPILCVHLEPPLLPSVVSSGPRCPSSFSVFCRTSRGGVTRSRHCLVTICPPLPSPSFCPYPRHEPQNGPRRCLVLTCSRRPLYSFLPLDQVRSFRSTTLLSPRR